MRSSCVVVVVVVVAVAVVAVVVAVVVVAAAAAAVVVVVVVVAVVVCEGRVACASCSACDTYSTTLPLYYSTTTCVGVSPSSPVTSGTRTSACSPHA